MVNGFRDEINYELEGNKKITLVFIHGLGLNLKMWKFQIPYFEDKYRILAYDLYGHGASQTSKQAPSLDGFTEQLNLLVDNLKLSQIVLIGFSLGGMIARHFALSHPKKIQGLIILNSAHRRTESAQTAIYGRYKKILESGPKSTVEDAIKRWFTPDFITNNKDKTNQVRSWILANKREVYAKNYLVLVNEVNKVVDTTNKISCPTLVLTSDEDFGNGPEMAKAIASEIKDAQLKVLGGLRHMALFEEPELVNQAIKKFLQGAGFEN